VHRSNRYVVSGAAILVMMAAGCSRSAPEGEGEAVEVPTISAEVAKVVKQDIIQGMTVRGVITTLPNEDVKISALVAGKVTAVNVAEGDSVRSGQIVAEIDPQPLEDLRRQASAALSQARAALENARLNLERTQRLLDRGIAAGKEVEDARAQMAAAEASVEQTTAALDTANRQMTRTRVASPIGGQVVKRLVSVGEQVDGTAAQPLLEVANLDRVELAANVPSEYLARVQVGQTVSVASDAYPNQSFSGEIIALAPAVDPVTNAALARILLRNPDRLFKIGMYANARVTIQDHRSALVIPPSAIVRDQGDTWVYILTGDLAQRTPVTVGIETPEAVEILSGVAEGQVVLTSAVYGLGERAKIANKS
jgi:membrane fusion protein, multidrug efflux system